MFFCGVACFFWLLTELSTSGRPRLILPLLFALAIVGGLRSYLQIVLALVAPATLLLQDRTRFPAKWRTVALLVCGSFLVVVLNGQTLQSFNPTRLFMQRYYAAQGAQSAFVVTPTPVPTGGAVQASGGSATAQIPAEADALTRRPLRNFIQWLPTGLAYAFAAPFPWASRRMVEQVTIPEMLLWYSALVCALVGLVAHRGRWRFFLPLVGYIVGLLLLLAATQGNLGTLVRHRSMVIPFMLVFSGAGAARLWRRRRQRGSPESPAVTL
jgi:hypothetical protein